MTDQATTPRLPQLDHDGDGQPGGAKKAPAKAAPGADDLVWMVSRAKGLHRAPAAETDSIVKAGGRFATDRDLNIGGVES